MTSGPRVAVVTGASRGLGEVVTRFLTGEGLMVVVNARHRDALRESVGRLPSGARVIQVPGDVADARVRRRIVGAVRALGHADVLVNNASELGPSPLTSMAELPLSSFERILRVNVIAPLALVQGLVPYLKKRRGLVINISSDAAVGAYPGWGGYGASKAALDLMSRTLSGELRGSGVSVVSVDPGDMRTLMHQAAFPGEDISDRPLPDVTLPFWAWLLGLEPKLVNGGRFQAQSERWEIPR
jgi:NAD(P)-dependent dehydrogenase (short-subunit alcohol dehydrogenase family)